MTPDLIRRLRVEETRSPVDAAFYAPACLDAEQRAAVAERFNKTFGQCTPPLTIAFKEPSE